MSEDYQGLNFHQYLVLLKKEIFADLFEVAIEIGNNDGGYGRAKGVNSHRNKYIEALEHLINEVKMLNIETSFTITNKKTDDDES